MVRSTDPHHYTEDKIGSMPDEDLEWFIVEASRRRDDGSLDSSTRNTWSELLSIAVDQRELRRRLK